MATASDSQESKTHTFSALHDEVGNAVDRIHALLLAAIEFESLDEAGLFLEIAEELTKKTRETIGDLWAAYQREGAQPQTPASAAPTPSTTPSPEPHVLRAQAFELVDQSGRVRARLACKPQVSSLRFFDKDGTQRTEIGFYDGEETDCAFISMNRPADAAGMTDEQFTIEVSQTDVLICARDAKGNETWRAPTGEQEGE